MLSVVLFYLFQISLTINSSKPSLSTFYSLTSFTWDRVWSYRRIGGTSSGTAAGDISLQNWNPGNDYPYGYLFKTRAQAQAEIANWQGGVNYTEMAKAEAHAYGWYHWYVNRNPFNRRDHFSLDGDVMGTGHGLSMFPYMRDVRRSIGLGNFILAEDDLANGPDGLTGRAFADRVATGSYNVDIHPLKSCTLPSYNYVEKPTLPFFIPFRALTNRDVPNLLVAGKTMAQSFKANAAIRLQPIEFSSGIAAGAAASVMWQNNEPNSFWALNNVGIVQSVARKYTPINWTINGVVYPKISSTGMNPGGSSGGGLTPATLQNTFCPAGSHPDKVLGYCVDPITLESYGPYPKGMVDLCIRYGGGAPCTELKRFTANGTLVEAPRWQLNFANNLRGTGRCPLGSAPDTAYKDYCVEEATQSASKVKEVYGPFPTAVVQKCFAAKGGAACYSNRWSYTYFKSLMGS